LDKPGGVCEQLLTDTENADKLEKIITAVNSADNLAFLIKVVETPKGLFTRAFLSESNSDIPPFTFLAFENYLEQTRTRSQRVAAALDKVITQEFGQTHAGVAVKWDEYLQQAHNRASELLASLQELQDAAKAEAKAKQKAKDKAKKQRQKDKKKNQR
jgi:hypothetical protein